MHEGIKFWRHFPTGHKMWRDKITGQKFKIPVFCTGLDRVLFCLRNYQFATKNTDLIKDMSGCKYLSKLFMIFLDRESAD